MTLGIALLAAGVLLIVLSILLPLLFLLIPAALALGIFVWLLGRGSRRT